MKSLATTIKSYDALARHYCDYLEERLPQFNLTRFSSFVLKSKIDRIHDEAEKRSSGGKARKKRPEKLRVLDIGCGGGRDSAYLAEEGFDVTGIDFSPKIIMEAKSRVKGPEFIVMDQRKLAFEDDFFDGLWCFGPLCHNPKAELQTTLSGFHRVLRPGGILFITTLEGEGEGTFPRKELQGKKVFCAYYSQIELEEALKISGFEIVSGAIEQPGERYVTVFARKNSDPL